MKLVRMSSTPVIEIGTAKILWYVIIHKEITIKAILPNIVIRGRKNKMIFVIEMARSAECDVS